MTKDILKEILDNTNRASGLNLTLAFFNGRCWLKDSKGNTLSSGTKQRIAEDLWMILKINCLLLDLHTDWVAHMKID